METKEHLEQEINSAIAAGAIAFVRIGSALSKIRDSKLYKEDGYSRFGDYTQEMWGFSRIHAHNLIQAARVYGYLNEVYEDEQLPSSESALRKMATLSKQECIEVWAKALERSPKPSRALISELVKAA